MRKISGSYALSYAALSFTYLSYFGSGLVNANEIEPLLFIKFEKGSYEFNNKYDLQEIVKNISQGQELIFVGVADNQEQYYLTLNRFNSIHSQVHKEAFFLIKSSERKEDEHMLSIYSVDKWDSNVKKIIIGNDHVFVPELKGMYTADSNRLFISPVRKKRVVSEGDNLIYQLDNLLKAIGWHLDLDSVPSDDLHGFIPNVVLVTLDDIATSKEVVLLLEEIFKVALPSYGYKLNRHDHEIKLVKQS